MGAAHPRLSSNLSIAIAAFLVIGLMTAGLFARDRRIKRYEAQEVARGLEGDVKVVHSMLDSRMPEPATVAGGIGRGEFALLRYGLPADAEWDSRPRFRALSAEEQQRVRSDLTEACLSLARGYALQVKPSQSGAEQFERAMRMNELAERVAGGDAPRAVWEQRAQLYRWMGNKPEAEKAAARAAAAPLQTGRDYYLSGSGALSAGRYREAFKLLSRAIELDPGFYHAHMALGTCHYQLGRFADAAGCYTTAIALRRMCRGGTTTAVSPVCGKRTIRRRGRTSTGRRNWLPTTPRPICTGRWRLRGSATSPLP